MLLFLLMMIFDIFIIVLLYDFFFIKRNQYMSIPAFIYRMVDHIYISDSRASYYMDLFQISINTTNILKSDSIITSSTQKARFIYMTKGNKEQSNKEQTDVLIDMIVYYQSSKYKILLYSQDTTSTCYLFIKYMMKRYHFTKEDIIRLIHITKLPPVYKKQMDDILQTL